MGMLSEGTYYRLVPKDPVANVRLRLKVYRRLQTDGVFRQAIWEMCRRDILFFINLFVWQYNPNTIGAGSELLGPFITWDFQDRAVRAILEAIEGRNDLVIEKSRELGASWLCLLVVGWALLFQQWKKMLVVSRNADAVDLPGDSDSLFWKLDFVHDRLPSFMVGSVERRKMSFVCKRTNSRITGQASTGKFGVGGRAWFAFVDEFSQIQEDYEVFDRTRDTTHCRIFNGTHLGTETCFYELCDAESVIGQYVKKVVMHWSHHPDKKKGLYRTDGTGKVEVLDKGFAYPEGFHFVMDGRPAGGPYPGLRSPWYDHEDERRHPRATATDLDINPLGSVTQFFDPLVIRNLIAETCYQALWRGELRHDQDGNPLGMEEGEGRLELWVKPDSRGRLGAGRYVVAADVSGGTGNTNSCLSVVHEATGEKVGAYVNPHANPHQLAPMAVALCRWLVDESGTPARLIWEGSGPGQTFGVQVRALGFTNYYKSLSEFKTLAKDGDKPGWYPQVDAKRLLLEDYREGLKRRDFINHCELSLKECLLFRYSANGSRVFHAGELDEKDPSGAGVNHGDRVMPDAMAWKLVKGAQAKVVVRSAVVPVLSLQWRRDLQERKAQEHEMEV